MEPAAAVARAVVADGAHTLPATTGIATVASDGAAKRASVAAVAHGKLRDTGSLKRDDFDGGPVSLDEIEPGLFLGNLSAATHMDTIKSFKITHILTLDSVPLPQHITDASFLTTKFIHIADMPKEDILHHLDACVKFICEALEKQGSNILVHCYFGVSRSSSVVIAYAMKRYNLDYPQAYEMVRSKRRFVQPNSGFMAQLKLYRRMGCTIDTQFQKYKIYRLRLAGEKVRKAKILPQNFTNVIKSDPAITQENPEPIVYRCRRCRRVVATKSHVLLHQSKSQPIVAATAAAVPASAPVASTSAAAAAAAATAAALSSNNAQSPRLLDQIAAQIRKVSLGSPLADGQSVDGGLAAAAATDANCRNIIFVEPIAWMKNIMTSTQGRLNCPKCEQKLGNFSWVNSCQCPCGEEVSPAFYLISSRVELSKAVQNVQTTV